MLANLLAIIIGLGSLAFYLAAFILPEVHRRSDFFWSGVGMFYAVVLWYCARQMNGAVLLGQTASVGLLLWLGYQTLRLRRLTTPAAQQTPIQLSKAERRRLNGTASRPIVKDYEFVEDGVEDTLEPAPDPNRPILIQPEADEFALKMVVPAAMAQSGETAAPPQEPPPTDKPNKPAPQKKTNPLEAVGIFASWLKELATPKKPEPKPMIELPPRPPSIPKPDRASASVLNTSAQASEPSSVSAPVSELSVQASKQQGAEPSPTSAASSVDSDPELTTAPTPSAPQQAADDEDSNWPDDEFWD